ncbi:MAG TPA: hypothetical protein PKC98_21305, partial [Candidatus Melainabacteria bacterium]|nr:hypothetical protein [Candidatus Melainabacteria bacterium]
MTAFESFDFADNSAPSPAMWQGESHPFAAPMRMDAVAAPGDASAAPAEIPAPVLQALDSGAPIRFSTAAENADAGREPDFYLGTDGQLVANPKATPSPDGSINIEMQTAEAKHQSLVQAIEARTEGQKKFAEGLIRHFQQNNPGQAVPAWMEDMANARPDIPNFVPHPPSERAPVTPPP